MTVRATADNPAGASATTDVTPETGGYDEEAIVDRLHRALEPDEDADARLSDPEDDEETSDDVAKDERPLEVEEDDAEDASDDDDTDEEDTEEDDAEDGDDDDDDDKPAKKYVEDDDSFVKVKVGDEEHEIPVRDLKRLAGRDAALTQKEMEVASLRKQTSETLQTVETAFSTILEQAKAKADALNKLDLLDLARTQPRHVIDQLRQDIDDANKTVSFLEEGVRQAQEDRQRLIVEEIRSQVPKTVAELSNPESRYHIEGFGTDRQAEVYRGLIDFGVEMGFPQEVVATETSPAALKLLHLAKVGRDALKARAEARAKTKAAKKAAGDKRGKSKAPARTRTASGDSLAKGSATVKSARERLRASGGRDEEAAVDLIHGLLGD